MKRKTLNLLLPILMIMLLSTTFAGAAENHITVTDYLGREVQVPKNIERIACLYSFTGHTTILLGRGDEVVAVPGGLTREILVTRLYPHIADASVPRQSGAINVEELLRTEADIVFIRASDIRDERERQKLDQSRIPYITVDFDNMEEQMRAIELMGEALDRVEEATRYLSFYQDTIQEIEEAMAALPEEEIVSIFHSTNQPTRTYSGGLSADWTRIMTRNVTLGEELLGGRQDASIEQIFIWDPEAILVNTEETLHYIKEDSQWAPLQAVRNDQIYLLPVGITRWGHHGSIEIPMAMLWTAKNLYPQYFEELDLVQETGAFYERFFGSPMEEEEILEILAGKGMREPK